MKYKHLLLIIAGIAIGVVACKKENKYLIVGKWQETKLNMYVQDNTGAKFYDTTYLQPFTNADFISINNNGTCIIGSDHYYYLNVPGQENAIQQIPANTSAMNYTAVGAEYVLTTQSTLINPGGFDVRDTVSLLNSNSLLLRTVAYAHDGIHRTITNAYYSR